LKRQSQKPNDRGHHTDFQIRCFEASVAGRSGRRGCHSRRGRRRHTTQFQLELDPAQLLRFNLSLKIVTDAINANSANAGDSVLTRGELGYVIRGIGLVQTLEDMGDIVVTQRNGTPIFVRDLRTPRLSNQERHGILGKDEKNDTMSGIVLLLRGENPSRVLDGIHAKVTGLNKHLKSMDVRIVPYLDRSGLVSATIDKVSHTVFRGIGIGFVLVVLILFLGSPRSAAIVGMTIPFATLVAFILMSVIKIPANLRSLGAIDFGIIVGASIAPGRAVANVIGCLGEPEVGCSPRSRL
jgi:cobalt-zinc-cadmium resistance protein CzcA